MPEPPLAASVVVGNGTFSEASGKAAGVMVKRGQLPPVVKIVNDQPGITRDWRVQASAEPVQSCLIGQLSDFGATLRYQLGADLYSSDSGGAVYEIDWLTEDGRKVHVTVDAETGAVLQRSGG